MPWIPTTEILRGQAARNLSAYRKAAAEHTQARIAAACSIVPSTLSDFNEPLERACLVFAAAGLKLVGQTERTVSPEDYRYLLKQQIRQAERELADLGDTRPGEL